LLPLISQRVLLVFHVGDQAAAFPLGNVQRIAPMAHLARPPGLPSVLEGFLNLTGVAVPVLRLDRLFQLPLQSPGLYSALIVVNGVSDSGPLALLVDRVSEVLTIQESSLLPVGQGESFNACAEGVLPMRGQMIHLLSPARLLLEKEREVLSRFQIMAGQRLRNWETQLL
jgi:purine-binding chemotaxis protein CheW